jgi:hypothetical protein
VSIVSSTHIVGHAQRDGRRYVTETHLDHEGVAYGFEYLASNDVNTSAVLSARAASLEAALAAAEIEALLNA